MRALRRAATTLATAVLLLTTMFIPSPANAVTTGQAWAVGNNSYGQLGDGTTTTRSVPSTVLGLSGVKAIAAGSTHSLALRSDGTVWSWGDNWTGQLGDGTTTGRTTPVKVRGLSGVKAIAAGVVHSLALRSDGTVWAWGYNGMGQIGDGTVIMTRTTPVKVLGLSGVKAIAAGFYNGFALLADGTVRGWGDDGCGQLGDGDTQHHYSPVRALLGLSGIKAIAPGSDHTLVLLTNGTVRALGCNGYGQLGDGTIYNVKTSPVRVKGLSGVTAIAAGLVHSLAVLGDGTVRAWGNNDWGQLGDGTVTTRVTPVKVLRVSSVVTIAAGANHNLAARSDGTVRGWGNNGHGQLGDGKVTVVQTTAVKALRLTGIKGLAGGWFHSLART
jgi:alpha-tubulin suppressor-like RCC1 family protein